MPLPDAHSADRDAIERNFRALAQQLDNLTGGSAAYAPTNVSTDRAYDANATTVDELADVLGNVIADLQAKGILS